MEAALNYEQLNWVCNIDKAEGEKVVSLMETGKWIMKWQEKHGFVLIRTEPVVDLLAEGNCELSEIKE